MQFEVSAEERKKATHPHDILLFNLIGNHILLTAIVGGLANNWPLLWALIPAISVSLLSFLFWRASRSPKLDTPFVQCHWQVAAKRGRIFLMMLGVLASVSTLAGLAHLYLGLMKEAAYALVGGTGILPVMVTMLVLIIMESDALHQAKHNKAPKCAALSHLRESEQQETTG
jgi:hypothetical protein